MFIAIFLCYMLRNFLIQYIFQWKMERNEQLINIHCVQLHELYNSGWPIPKSKHYKILLLFCITNLNIDILCFRTFKERS